MGKKEKVQEVEEVEETLTCDKVFYGDKNKSLYLYYEVEVNYLHDSTRLIIGFIDRDKLENYSSLDFPGKIESSVGFNVKNGEVYIDENIVYTFNFMDQIQEVYEVDDSKNFDFNGCFFGIGVALSTQEFFFTFNGRILNSLSFQAVGEMRY